MITDYQTSSRRLWIKLQQRNKKSLFKDLNMAVIIAISSIMLGISFVGGILHVK